MADIVKSVEFFELSTTADQTSATMTKGQDPDNCVPFLSVRTAGFYFYTNYWDCTISGSTVYFDRWAQASSAQCYINCYVVEFEPDEVYVESGTFDVTSSSPDEVTTSSGFDPNYTAMVHWWKTSSGVYADRAQVRGRVVSSGTVDFHRNTTTDSAMGHWYIFEAKNGGFSVDHVEYSDTGSLAYFAANKSSDYLKTFLISSATGPHQYPSYSSIYTDLYTRSNIMYKRGSVSSTIYGATQIVEFQDNKIHVLYSGVTELVAAVGSENVGWYNAMGLATTSGFSSVMRDVPYIGQSPATSNTSLYDTAFCTVKLASDGKSLTIQREDSASFYVKTYTCAVDWKGITTASGTNPSPLDSTESFVKSVENFRIVTYAQHGRHELSKGQVLNNCVVFASYTGDTINASVSNCLHEVYLSDTRNVFAYRVGTVSSGIVDVSVVEFYPDQVRVQSGTAFGDLANSAAGQDITLDYSVVPEKSFIVFSQSVTLDDTYWARTTVRGVIADADTLNFYNYWDNNTSLSWFLAEDITSDNSCFKVDHWTYDTAGGYLYATTSGNFYPQHRTFLLLSSASAYSGNNYLTYQSPVSIYYLPGVPHVAETISSSTTNYYAGQVVAITRSGRKYVDFRELAFTGTTTSQDHTLEATWSGISDISVINASMMSCGACGSTTASVIPSAFATARIVDYDTLTVRTDIGMGAGSFVNRFNITAICWQGINTYDYTVNTSIKKALVNSIEIIDTNTDDAVYQKYLTSGQNGNNCVPFGHWQTYHLTAYPNRWQKHFYIDTEAGYPHSIIMSRLLEYDDTPPSNNNSMIYLLEFNPERVKIQKGVANMLSEGEETEINITIDPVVTSKAFIVFYVIGGSFPASAYNFLIAARFTDTSTITFKRTSGTKDAFINWYVVECLDDSWTVHHYYDSNTYTAVSQDTDPGFVVDKSKSILLSSYCHTYSSYIYPTYWALKSYITLDNMIRVERNTASYNFSDLCFQLIVLNTDDIRVLQLVPEYTLGTYSGSLILDPPLSETRHIIINSTVNNMSAVQAASQSNGPATTTVYKYIDNFDTDATVELRSEYVSTYITKPGFYVLEFPEFSGYYFEGTTKELDVPVSRDVRLYRSDTGALVDYAVSASGTGYFYLESTYSGTHYAVALDDDYGLDFNHLIYGKLLPSVISGTFAHNEGLIDISGLDIGTPTYLT